MIQIFGFFDVFDLGWCQFMNLLIFGMIIGVVVGVFYLVVKYLIFFFSGGLGGGVMVKDVFGNDVKVMEFLVFYNVGDWVLVQGLKGDLIYIVVQGDDTIVNYGINVVCIYLGCVVFWNVSENKFMCFCYGFQYNVEGKVVCGLVFFFLVLVYVIVIDDDKLVFSIWIEIDFCIDEDFWWVQVQFCYLLSK